jgi:MFS superfamily sulfate permease-like transporter
MPVSRLAQLLSYEQSLPPHSSEFHREQLSIENSMRDLDSAVGRLDNILMSLYVIIAVLIIAVAFVRIPKCRLSKLTLTTLSGSVAGNSGYWCWHPDSRFVCYF